METSKKRRDFYGRGKDGEMSRYNLIATSTFGVESVVADELRALGYTDLTVENGKISFVGDERDIARCNLWLRTADRVLLKMAEFKATSFEELFQGTLEVEWERFIPENGKMHVVGKSVRSKLYSVPDCQSIVKKAMIEGMKRRYKRSLFKEDGPVYKVEVSLLKDLVTLAVDSTGPGLHKRGYRAQAGAAPLKETLAAALVILSRWAPGRVLADPFCGSGTIPIEAALIAKRIAPGLNRNFVSEEWPLFPKKIWRSVREEAQALIRAEEDFSILASDLDGRVLRTARENVRAAGVERVISIQKQDFSEFRSKRKFGCIICNPPYGERLGDEESVRMIYRALGDLYTRLDSWSLFALTPDPEFQGLFGKKADKNRKLYNGRIKCYYYQYFGPLPKSRESGNLN